MESPTLHRSVRTLQRLLREHAFDLRNLDLAGFRCWIERHLSSWRRDAVQRSRIRDMRRASPELKALEKAHRGAVSADVDSPQHARLRQLEREVIDTSKAIAGLTDALKQARVEDRPALRQKKEAFRARSEALEEEQTKLVQSSLTRQNLLGITADLDRRRVAIGLDREEIHLRELMTQQGRRAGRSGESFEHQAHELTERCIVPDLIKGSGDEARKRIRVLHRVRIGAARTELDQVVVRLPRRAGAVEVLAVVEVKRNLNDLAKGFCQRQENLAWLTGHADGYDSTLFGRATFGPATSIAKRCIRRMESRFRSTGVPSVTSSGRKNRACFSSVCTSSRGRAISGDCRPPPSHALAIGSQRMSVGNRRAKRT
jgi:hypothetical protein